MGHRDLLLDRVYPQWKGKFLGASTMGCACMLDSWVCGVVWRGVVCQITSDTCLYDHDYDDHYQWRSKASVGPGSTVTWGPSVASAQGLKLEAQSAESGDGALGTACYRAWGPRFYEPPEPPVSTLLITITAIITTWTKTIHGVLDISSVTSGKLTQSNELWRRIEQLVTRSQRQVSAFHLLS